MAKNVIDPNVFYKAGYASAYDPTKDRSHQNQLIDSLFGMAGKWAINRYKNAFEDLAILKEKGNRTQAGIQMDIQELGEKISPKMQAKLEEFKKEYDKGSRMAEMPTLIPGRKKKGQLMQEMAWQKMKNLRADLTIVEEEVMRQQDAGLDEQALPSMNNTGHTWNEGADPDEFTNGTRLASGKMLENMDVDEFGRIIVWQQQLDIDTSEPAYNEYLKKKGVIPGTHDDYVTQMQSERRENEIISGDEFSAQMEREDVLNYDEWVEQSGIDATKPTRFSKLKFPGPSDQTLSPEISGVTETAFSSGEDGMQLSEMQMSQKRLEVNRKMKNASENSLRSWLFGGEIVMYYDDKVQTVTPAHKILIDGDTANRFLGMDGSAAEGTPEYAAYERFQGALSDFKSNSDFSKQGGAEIRSKSTDLIMDSVKAFNNDGYKQYLAKQGRDKNKSKGDKQTMQIMSPGGGYQTVNKKDWEREHRPLIKALNSNEKNIPVFNGPGGVGVKKQNGKYYTRDNDGAWFEISKSNLAESNRVIDYVDIFEEDSGSDGDSGNDLTLTEEEKGTVQQQELDRQKEEAGIIDANNDGVPDEFQPELFNR